MSLAKLRGNLLQKRVEKKKKKKLIIKIHDVDPKIKLTWKTLNQNLSKGIKKKFIAKVIPNHKFV